MNTVSDRNFGILIAYLVPGFTTLWGASFFSVTIREWLTGATAEGPTVGGFLYVTLAATAAGLTVSTIRWATIDTIHHKTGIARPTWDFGQMQRHFNAYDRLEYNHYAYYKAHGNMVIAMAFLFLARRVSLGLFLWGWIDLAVIALGAIFFSGSRDTLRKFYVRTTQLLATSSRQARSSRPSQRKSAELGEEPA